MRLLVVTASLLAFQAFTSHAGDWERVRDPDPKIDAVMRHLLMTEPVTDPAKREELRKLYDRVPKKAPREPIGGGGPPKPEALPPEGSLKTNVRLFKPEDIQQHKAAVILLKQPLPPERVAHYAVILADSYFLGWTLDILNVTSEKGVLTVKAMWHPRIRTRDGISVTVNNPLEETWDIVGDEAKLRKTDSLGPANYGMGSGGKAAPETHNPVPRPRPHHSRSQ